MPVERLPLAGLEVGEPVTLVLEQLDEVVGAGVSLLEHHPCIIHAHLREERGHRFALLAPQGSHSLVGGKVGSPKVWLRWRQPRCTPMAAVATGCCGSRGHLVPIWQHSPFPVIFLASRSSFELLFFPNILDMFISLPIS